MKTKLENPNDDGIEICSITYNHRMTAEVIPIIAMGKPPKIGKRMTVKNAPGFPPIPQVLRGKWIFDGEKSDGTLYLSRPIKSSK